jgi:hypothetical protein
MIDEYEQKVEGMSAWPFFIFLMNLVSSVLFALTPLIPSYCCFGRATGLPGGRRSSVAAMGEEVSRDPED